MENSSMHSCSPWHSRTGVFFFSLLLLMLSIWSGAKAWNAFREHKFIGVPIERNTISITGEGKIVAVPDVATVSMGTSVERKTVAEAQKENTKSINALIAKLKELGVDKKDVQTSGYNISPVYDYLVGRSVLRGYQVSQNVEVKIRNLDKVGDVIATAGEFNLNQVGGVQFKIDEPEAVRQQAREKALANAKEKADVLADQLGVKLRRVISFSESGAPYQPVPMYAYDKVANEGMGGATAPTIEAGSTDVISNVTVTYEIE